MKKVLIVSLQCLLSLSLLSQNGNIGIGTATPRYPLSFDVPGGDKISLYDDGNPTGIHFGLGVQSGGLFQVYAATSFDDIAFGIGKSDAFTERMRIKGNGNVGIGTSTPRYLLSFNPASGDKISLFDDGNPAGVHFGMGVQSGTLLQLFAATLSDDIAFGVGKSDAFTERMRITGDGNVGIGTSTPGYPLNFSNVLGDKISLYGNTGNHYGFGIQGGLLQIYSDAAAANIAFGYGSSSAFNERMRIINNGPDGLAVRGRLQLRNGTFPNDPAQGPGIWLYTPDNLGPQLAFMGVQNNQNVGFYGGPAGWGFTYDAINSRVGIGNNNPNAPLAFPASLGKKITLYPGATGDVGFAVAGNRLQIYSDNPNADVAFGYDAAGVFNERFAVKPNGALAVSASTGSPGQVITSNGSAATASWQYPTHHLYQSIFQAFQSVDLELTTSSPTTALPGMSHTITVGGNAKFLISFNVESQSLTCCGFSRGSVAVFLNGVYQYSAVEAIPSNNWSTINGTRLLDVPAGTHTIDLRAYVADGPNMRFWGGGVRSNFIVQVISD